MQISKIMNTNICNKLTSNPISQDIIVDRTYYCCVTKLPRIILFAMFTVSTCAILVNFTGPLDSF